MHLRFHAAALAASLSVCYLLAGCAGAGTVPHRGTASSYAAPASYATSDSEFADTTTAAWRQPFYDAAHTGYNPLETTLGVSNVGSLTQLWSLATGGQITDPILVHNGVAFVNSGDGYLYAVNAASGAQLWKFETYEGSSSDNAPVIADGKIVLPCLLSGSNQQSAMCALNIGNGKLVWDYVVDCNCLPPAGPSASAVASGDTVVFDYANGSTNSAYVVAVSAENGSALWSIGLPHGPDFWSSTIAGGQIFYSTGSGVCAAALSSGSENWCTSVGSDPSVAVANGVAYVNTFSNGIYALNASTGAQIWQTSPAGDNNGGYFDPPAIAKGVVYVSGIGGYLYAMKAATGAALWNTSADTSHATNSSPTVANGVVYAGCSGGFCAYNAKNGALLYNPGSGNSQYVSPSIVNGVVFVNCGPNNACAYH